MIGRLLLVIAAIGALIAATRGAFAATAPPRPNVVLLVFDDLNDWVLENPRVHAPNFQRLAQSGTAFSRAYAAAPSCGPSRTAFLTGVQPTTSGLHFNNQPFRRSEHWIARATTLPEHFVRHGYSAAGYGKLFHYDGHEKDTWTPGQQIVPDGRNEAKQQAAAALTRVPHWPQLWGVLPDDWNRDDPGRMQQDALNARRMADFVSARHERPFFAALGIYRPHTRWLVPKRFYDLYPVDSIQEPAGCKPGDVDDLPRAGRWLAEINITPHVQRQLRESGKWREAIQAYLAAVSYADSELGRVLDALEKGPNSANTVLVVFSDHGYHLGEKEHWHKMALWERATKVPLIVSLPEQRRRAEGRVVATPVSLLDLYPTLIALCGLPAPDTHKLEGVDLGPALSATRNWTRPPVLTSYGIGNNAVRDARYRYIRYADGSEELYDHDADPHEWNNLAGDPALRPVIERLAKAIPPHAAPYLPFDGDRDGRAAWLDEEIFSVKPGR